MPTCGECSHWRTGSDRNAKEMSRHGFGVCGQKSDTIEGRALYLPMRREHECGMFSHAGQPAIKARVEFMKQQDRKLAALVRKVPA